MSVGTPPDFIQRPHSRLPISTVSTSRVRPVSGFDFRSEFRSSNYAAQIDSDRTHRFGELHASARPSTTLTAKLESVRDKRRSIHRRSLSLSSVDPTSPEGSNSLRSHVGSQARRQQALSICSQPPVPKYASRIESVTPRVLKSFSGNRMRAVTTADAIASDCPMTTSKQMTENSTSTSSSIARLSETASIGTSSSARSMHSLPRRRLESDSRRPINGTPTSSTRSSALLSPKRQLVRPPSAIETPSACLSTKKPARPTSRMATPSTIRRPITSLSIVASSPTTNRPMDSTITTATTTMSPTTRRVASVHAQATRFGNDDSVRVNLTSQSVTRSTTSLSRVKQTPSRIVRPSSGTIEALPQRKNLRSTATRNSANEPTVSVHSAERVSPVQSASNRMIKSASERSKSSSCDQVVATSSPVNGKIGAKAKSIKTSGKRQNVVPEKPRPEDSVTASQAADDYYQNIIDTADLKGWNGISKVVHRRIQDATKNGTLELSNLGLGSVPDEVYELLQNGQDNGESHSKNKAKAELTTFVATHNSISRLDDRFTDGLSQLVSIDLRHNGLRKIPPSMSKLDSLTVLNLSANKLTNESLSVLFTIRSLVDLDIQANRFDGEIPSSLCNLVSLEVLNVNNNEFSSIAPSAFTGLCNLQRLNAKSNKLRRFPFDSIEAAPIVELDVSYNKLSGSLISIDRISRFSELRVLQASHNQIKVVSDFAIMLPCLEVLDLNSNIAASLGMLLLCTPSLVQLHISRNMIPALPEGIMELRNLKLLDISYNLFTTLDSRLGLIDSLETLRWNGNKFGERSLAAMDTKEVKMRLRARYEREMLEEVTHDEPDVDDEFLEMAMKKRVATSQSYSKQLDLSGREYSEFAFPDRVIERYLPGQYYRYGSDAITELHLERNAFSTIPDIIMSFAFADALQSLDLSHNILGEDAFKFPVTLRSLLDLNLSCNLISSLIMFVANFKLQNLQKLDLSFNKIRHVPLNLVMAFPTLEELNLHENKISEIDAQAFKGLEKIDLSNNSIRYLPPELGKIKTIVTLKVHGNTFKTPRWQIVQKGTDALMEWLRLRLPEDV
ncbi:hypothetical protein V1525DRAFT_394601, partial [Lipomyces kononenkoae]